MQLIHILRDTADTPLLIFYRRGYPGMIGVEQLRGETYG